MNRIKREHLEQILQAIPELTDKAIKEMLPPCMDGDEPCKVCGGLGFVGNSHGVGHPDFGKLKRCENNPLSRDIKRKEKLRKWGNMERYERVRLGDYDINPTHWVYTGKRVESLALAREMCVTYANSLSGFLVLRGGYGTGKTMLAAAIGNERLEVHGDAVLFFSVPNLLDTFRASYNSSEVDSYESALKGTQDTKLLILDDLGSEKDSEWVQEKIFQVIDHRYANNLPTIITTNEKLENLEPRISSRLMDTNICKHVYINAPDYRRIGYTSDGTDELNMLHLYHAVTSETLKAVPNGHTGREASIIERMKTIAETYPLDTKPFMYIWDKRSGNGKTHWAAAIANQYASQGRTVMMVSHNKFLDWMRTQVSTPHGGVAVSVMSEKIEGVDLLVLDKFKYGVSSGWTTDKFLGILETRFVSDRRTILTSRIEPGKLKGELQTMVMDNHKAMQLHCDLKPYHEAGGE